jgi:hypothetical protein
MRAWEFLIPRSMTQSHAERAGGLVVRPDVAHQPSAGERRTQAGRPEGGQANRKERTSVEPVSKL